MVSWNFIFNDVLDAEKLHGALWRLLGMDGWRKLGGRLRLNAKGKLEVHVPRVFTSERPAVHFTHSMTNTSIDEHPVGSQLPKSTNTLSIQNTPAELFHALGLRRGGNVPITVYDLVRSDEPQLSVHVTNFTDATLVGILYPHTMMDGMGRVALIQAWSLVLAGRETEVPTLAGTRDDIMATVGTASDITEQEPWMMMPMVMSGLGKLRWGSRLLWDILWCPQADEKVMCVPPALQEQLRRQAQKELVERRGSEAPFISNSDVLAAWVLHLVGRSQPQPRPMTLSNVVELRSRLPSVFSRPANDEVYVQNITARTHVFLSAAECAGLSLGETALKVREAISLQAAEPQVRAQVREQRRARAAGESFMLFGDPDAVMLFLTNQTKDGVFKNSDFGPAVVQARSLHGTNPPGTPVYTHSCFMKKNFVTRYAVSFRGKDYIGNVWVNLVLAANVWDKIERQLKKTEQDDIKEQILKPRL